MEVLVMSGVYAAVAALLGNQAREPPKLGSVLIVVSPAKSLDYESPLATKKASEPRMLDESARLVDVMAKKTPGDLQEIMHISPALAELNIFQ